ncbi:SgcJ/EcaC family oxidoreductase [Streptomyces sp. Qhu-G9]|uniref:SgcJ/EcaC family oxidoreductase n=1 Tax=Streptomyces sp. Qhu-G9 TaxID=3452799 RepID=UPI0022AC8F05|nr:SgcJ/EcaC family oxidoreductase [Streptomyces aurantiacus]WAU81546.1 SgcJ/EcaC family oxidoreductase [Streptomyces aurantiacus]
MKYMLLVRGEDSDDPAAGEPVGLWAAEQGARGVRLHGHRLRPSTETVTVRVRDGEVLRTDGPFAETKEIVGGFDVLECRDLDEALEVAARHPGAADGSVEVRGLWDDEDAETRIRRIDAELTAAARERDAGRMAACYAPDAEVFHPMSGLEQRGADAFRTAQEWWFSTVSGPVDREVVEFRVRVDESVAFSHALVRMRATLTDGEPLDSTLRVTTGYRAAGDRWRIVHQHMSVPFDAGITGIAGNEEDRS